MILSGKTSDYSETLLESWWWLKTFVIPGFEHWVKVRIPTRSTSLVVLVQFSSVAQSCPTLCDPMNCISRSLLKLMSIELVVPSSHLILCHPLLLLPPIPPSIRVFSNESTLYMRWPKYWSFSFSIIPSKEHPGPISLEEKLWPT